jgi:hypothetical protein
VRKRKPIYTPPITVGGIFIYVLLCVICAWIAAQRAREKNRSAVKWFIIGLLANAAAVYALKGLPKKIDPWDYKGLQEAEEIERKKNALDFCYHCGQKLEAEQTTCPVCKQAL